MSSEIYYKRAYIKVGEKFIPLVQHGSSNTFEISYSRNGRKLEIAERNWGTLWWKDRSKMLHTVEEIRQMADDLAEIAKGGGVWKARNNAFTPDEILKWVVNGMKSACTVEEYIEAGNTLFLLDYSREEQSEWEKHYFSTEKELLELLETLKGSSRLNIEIMERELSTPWRLRKPSLSRNTRLENQARLRNGEHYILKNSAGHVFSSLKKGGGGYRYVWNEHSMQARCFPTSKAAEKYLFKNIESLNIRGEQFKVCTVKAA